MNKILTILFIIAIAVQQFKVLNNFLHFAIDNTELSINSENNTDSNDDDFGGNQNDFDTIEFDFNAPNGFINYEILVFKYPSIINFTPKSILMTPFLKIKGVPPRLV